MACVRKLNVCETFLLLIVTRTCEIKALAASWVIGCKSFALQGTHVFVERSKSTKSKEKKTRKVMSITSVVICERKKKQNAPFESLLAVENVVSDETGI